MLKCKKFEAEEDLLDFVNENDKLITIFGICNNEFRQIVLFYVEGENDG